ncbi:hypothetical protein ACN50C_10110 [Levilactobacillus brevis]|jgi:hypothetical protein|uniref:Integral membrane protein n=4 Tax=Levilactobacillus brevis TaxID=1580 RepID=Q03QA3_LEVBA|nr:hypothetical protein [Levilactobacillus brevis]MBL3536969.1 hypothetical protein [Lactobacillus sp. GPR40-2]MBL3629923.1 hypothetical protein [Lactobacillus sp. GPB7-4]BAN07106.1 conserved hypothetical protein [Levilactobacillus brevis KB290]ABJ64619.1 hypothetical protein LVIS_1524 [Levilactobacillus brevis ATCC 367]ARQ92222.1 hypothetical protein A6F60_00210 [Levilactobacillus brevis]
MTTLMAFLKNRTVQQLVIFTVCQNSLWWLASSTVNTGSPLTTLVKIYLVVYGGLLAAGIFLILNHQFRSRIGPVLVVAAVTMGFLAAPNVHLVQLFALLLCLFLVLVCIPQLGLQSIYGLIVFSCLAGYGVPVILFFLRNHYLALQFLVLLLPLVASYLVFFEPYYLPAERDWRLTLISPIILLIIMGGIAFSWRVLVVMLIVGGHWWLQPRLNARYRLIASGCLQLIAGLFILL